MSIICPVRPNETTPDCSEDIAINFLKDIFGAEWVGSFYEEGSDHPAVIDPATDTIMSLIATNLSSAALIVAFLIIIFTIYRGLISAANDGASVGLSEKSSILGMLGRPLFSLTMLAPTISGYPVVYVLVMSITLMANGMANMGLPAYIEVDLNESAISARLDDQNYLAANDMLKPMFYGAMHGFCTNYANSPNGVDARMVMVQRNTYHNSKGDSFPTRAEVTSSNSPLSRIQTSIEYKDIPENRVDGFLQWFGIGNSGITGDVCGGFSSDFTIPLEKQTASTEERPLSDIDIATNTIFNNIASKGGIIAELRRDAALRAYYTGYTIGNGALPFADSADLESPSPAAFCSSYGGGEHFQYYKNGVNAGCNPPTNLNTSPTGWAFDPEEYSGGGTPAAADRPNIPGLVLHSLSLSKDLNESVKLVLEDDPVDAAIKDLTQFTLKQGWMAAGYTRTRTQKFRNQLQNALYAAPYSVSFANISGDGDGKRLDKFVTNLNAVKGSLFNRVSKDPRVPTYSNFKLEATVAASENNNWDLGVFMEAPANTATQLVFDYEEKAIEAVMGIGPQYEDVDAITRMQMVGELISSLGTALALAHKAVLFSLAVVGILASFFKGVAENVYDVQNSVDNSRTYYMDMLGTWIFESSEALFTVGRVFSVIIPTMPYVFLTLAAVGWFMQIIQTSFGMLLFFIMHAIPEKSFVGSQAQGYVTLVSLFFRPLIILAAFFLSFVLYEPVITYASQMYFSIHSEVAGSSFESGTMKFFVVISTFKFYWYVYASMVMMLTYLVFGLIQELGDAVLNWIGTNLLSGFGNLETNGVMKNADVGMKQAANSANARREQGAQTRAAQGKGDSGKGKGEGEGEGSKGGDKVDSKKSDANTPANQPAANRSSVGGTGPAPVSGGGAGGGGGGGAGGVGSTSAGGVSGGAGGIGGAIGSGGSAGASAGSDKGGAGAGRDRGDVGEAGKGSIGIAAMFGAGTAAIGGVRGGFQGAKDGYKGAANNFKNPIARGFAGSAGAAGGAVIGTLGGAAYGAARGVRTIGGATAYQANRKKALDKGHIGTKGFKGSFYSKPAPGQAAAKPSNFRQAPTTATGSASNSTSRYGSAFSTPSAPSTSSTAKAKFASGSSYKQQKSA